MIIPSLPVESILFYAFSGVLIFSALMVITIQNPVRSALFLVLGFFASAALWLMLEAEFLALVLVLVYVGAVMTLFLFVVMTINIDLNAAPIKRYLPMGMLITTALVGITTFALIKSNIGALTATHHAANYNNTEELGSILYTQYAYPFEIAGVLLLVAIIAAISLSFREQRNRKVQRIEQQIAVKREDRVRLIKMAAELKPPLAPNNPDLPE